ncbi:Sec-independent protein translocase TatB [Salinibacterium sp. UTAS2018]|uniref:sec-independent translocase n=1 Tax=unclassified Salinibacterium TaxID=2632331 RepID=UPI0010097DF2|nr:MULTISPECIES: sec-independent translocase [unclassified Salinibacterium]MBH0010071.1 Sec-independent protein translocase TatB [Salinibacterium sp. SWN1162]QAV71386.1 Sec-independent protein translocase TatB [Salinibacterium sp. UTAS2018]
MSFGLTFDKLLIIGIIAVFLLGPDRLPYYASQLARLVRSLRDMASGAKDRMREEMGPDFDDIDWKQLDPRQYDPRRIIRDALLEDETPPVKVRPPRSAAYAERQAALAERQSQLKAELKAGERAPFDNEAT